MEAARLPFVVRPSEAEEITTAESPELLTETNALLKARPVSEEYPDSIVIGADTMVFLDGQGLGKPADMVEAREMVGRLSGRTHEVITGVALIHRSAKLEQSFHVSSKVTFKALGPEEISVYLKLINPLDKAGGYAAQEHGEKIIAGIEGPESNVIGLPIERLLELLGAEPWNLLRDQAGQSASGDD